MLGLRNMENSETQLIVLKKGQRNKSLWKFVHCWNFLRELAYKKLAQNRDTLISAYEKDFSLKKMLVTKLVLGNLGLARAAFSALTQFSSATSLTSQFKIRAFVISILQKSHLDLTLAYYTLKHPPFSSELPYPSPESACLPDLQ